MSKQISNKRKHKTNKKLLHTVLLIIILLVLLYWVAPMLGITVGLGALSFGYLLTTLVLLAVGILLLPILAGIGVLFLTVLFIIAGAVGFTLFPLALPFLIPIAIITFFVWLISKLFK